MAYFSLKTTRYSGMASWHYAQTIYLYLYTFLVAFYCFLWYNKDDEKGIKKAVRSKPSKPNANRPPTTETTKKP